MNSVPRTTTLIGGWLLALVGVLELLPIVLGRIPTADGALYLFRSGPAQAVHVVALSAGCLILAFGFRRELGIAGSSLVGRAAFVLVALAFPIQGIVFFALFSEGEVGTLPGFLTGTALQLLPVAAVLVAALAVVRARILEGFARWSLLAYGVTQVLVFALSSVPSASQSYHLVVFLGIAAVPPCVLLATGLSFVLYGRADAVKRQLITVYTKWRLTTSVH